jgi:hypothetical protein
VRGPHATFTNGKGYRTLQQYRDLVAKQEHAIVGSFIKKFVTYVNGAPPSAAATPEINRIIVATADKQYRIVDVIIATCQSPLIHGRTR